MKLMIILFNFENKKSDFLFLKIEKWDWTENGDTFCQK